MADYGSDKKQVTLSAPFGDGVGSWHLNVDGYHWGSMWKRGNMWVFYGGGKEKLTLDDIAALGEMIEEEAIEKGWSTNFKPF